MLGADAKADDQTRDGATLETPWEDYYHGSPRAGRGIGKGNPSGKPIGPVFLFNKTYASN